jgi:pimeloyl-ACP methyl ester carboxylesterase
MQKSTIGQWVTHRETQRGAEQFVVGFRHWPKTPPARPIDGAMGAAHHPAQAGTVRFGATLRGHSMNHAPAIAPTTAFVDLSGEADRDPARDPAGPSTPGKASRIEYKWLNPELDKAPIAVFLREGLGSVAMWKDWPRQLCDLLGMRGLVYSRPGYGQSTPRAPGVKWPADFMDHQACQVLPALLEQVLPDPAARSAIWLIGHSDGASIALLHAAAQSARYPAATYRPALAGVVAIAPHVSVESKAIEAILQTRRAYKAGNLRDSLARYHADVDSAFYGWSDIWLDPAFRRWNIESRVAQIQCPLLAVQCHDDEYGTMEQIDAIGRAVPQATLAKLDHGGHSPHRGAPGALNAAIAAFIG